MIKSINLTCFRKHENLSINLTEGLQTFRGVNEAGKTTILEGAAYALFGSKALRDSLADVVTWGRKETELAAEVVLALDKDYIFKRSKAGAEVIIDGVVFVTGQNEVSAFAASLLGADVNVAHHLMLASQGSLRGVLEQGPKATSTLIEGLSDLDVIDRIVEAAQAKLTLGSTAVLEDRLKQIENELANTKAPEVPAEPDVASLKAELAEGQNRLEAAVIDRNKAEEAYTVAKAVRDQRDALERDRLQVLQQAEDTGLQLAAEKAKAEDVVASPDNIRAALAAAEDHDNRLKAYRTFSDLTKPDMILPAEKFKALETRVRGALRNLQIAITESKASIRALEPQVATSHNCPACGQDTAHLEQVKVKQAQVQAELQQARVKLAEAEAALPEALENVTEIEGLLNAHSHNLKLAGRIAQYVTVDDSVVPVGVTWNGAVPGGEAADVQALRQQLAEIEAAIAARDKAKAKVEALREVVAGCAQRNAEIDRKIADLSPLSDDDFTAVVEAFQAARDAATTLEGSNALLVLKISEVERVFADEKAAYERALAQVEALTKSGEQLRADIEGVQFNNGLVKKVRAARPIIANKLWNLVLATVSTLFSQMRGEASIVTREGDKFLINGRSSSVSGSTLDILGLAIRCALVKTFIPNCPFLVLDEPSAACDADRTAALIGFVAGAGFKQILLVTHEDASEALSSNLIQI